MATNNIYSMGTVSVGGTPATKAPTNSNPGNTGTTATQTTVPAPAVFTGAKAVDFLNTTVVPTMNNANQSIIDQQKKAEEAAKAAADAKKAQEDAAKKASESTKTTETTAPVGTKTAYKTDGTSVFIPIGANATDYGYSDTKPTEKPVADTAELASGTTVKQYADGTYGLYNAEGQLLRIATATEFSNAKKAQEILNNIDKAVNGNYPLTAAQNAQIQAVKDAYGRLIEKQTTANANFTGGTTIFQNLYGMGNTPMGQGEIQTSINEGIKKITDIQTKMNSDVASMTQAFQQDNLEALKSAYEAFSKNQSELQKSIDAVHKETTDAATKAQDNINQTNSQIDNDIRGLIGSAVKNGATDEQLTAMQEALANHDFSAAAKAGGDSLLTASGIVGEYYAYVKDAKSRGIEPMSFDDYQTKDANRKARIAAAGTSIALGTNMTTKQQAVFNSIVGLQNKSPLIVANDRAVILKSITDELEADPSNAGLQVSFIYSFIQALDTYQSAVREGEIGLVQGTQGLSDKIENLPSKIEQGNPLNPSVALNYAKIAKKLTTSINLAAEQKKNVYRAQAMSNGIGDQYNQWDNTITELNKQTIGSQHIDSAKDDPLNVMSKTSTTNQNNPMGI